MNDSRANFIRDMRIRGSGAFSWLLREWNGLSSESRHALETPPPAEEAAYIELHDRICDSWKQRGVLVRAGREYPVEDVFYHSVYGWVLRGGEAKAYLGKISTPDRGRIIIGHRSYFSGASEVRGEDELKVGSYVSIAEGLYANASPDFHPTHLPAMLNFATEKRWTEDGLGMEIGFRAREQGARGISIGDDVWIGRQVRIFHGARIATGCVIAERSLVRGETEPYGVYAGIPAKLKKFRFPEAICARLLEIAWWNWSEDRILRNRKFFSTDLSRFDGSLDSLIQD